LLEKLVGPDVGLWDRTILNDESKISAIEGINSDKLIIVFNSLNH
jgi:hypothetical protein